MEQHCAKFPITLFLTCNIAEIKIRQHGSPSSLSFTPGANLQGKRDPSTGQNLKVPQPKVLALQKDGRVPSQAPHLWFRMRWIIIHSGLMP